MSDVTIDGTELRRFQDALLKFWAETGEAMPELVVRQTGLLALDMQRKTQFTKRPVGRKIVSRDLDRAVQLIDGKWADRNIKAEWLKQATRKILEGRSASSRAKRVAKLREVFARAQWKNMEIVDKFDPVEHHKQKRDSRGRVRRGKKTHYTVDSRPLKAYRRKMLGAVGWTPAGWNKALATLGRGTKGRGGIPAFILKHGLRGSAMVSSGKDQTTVTITNPQVKIPDYRRIVQRSLKGRRTAMMTEMRKTVRAQMKKRFR